MRFQQLTRRQKLTIGNRIATKYLITTNIMWTSLHIQIALCEHINDC